MSQPLRPELGSPRRARRLLRWVVGACAATLVLGSAPAQAASYSSTPSATHSWRPNGHVYGITVAAGTVYVVGSFTNVRNLVTDQVVARNRAAAFDAATGALRPWNPDVDGGRVRAVAVTGATAYLGGNFTTVGDRPRQGVAAVDAATGALRTGFVADADGEVRDLVVLRGSLVVGGEHRRVSGVARRALTKVDAVTGAVDRSFDARLGRGAVFALDRGPRKSLIAGGSFTRQHGSVQKFLAGVRRGTGARAPWSPQPVCGSCHVIDLDVTRGLLGLAIGGGGGGRAAIWDLSSWRSRWRWVRRGDGDVQAVALHDGVLHAGGHFGPTFAGRTEHQLVSLTAANGSRTSLKVPFTGPDSPGIWALHATDEHLRVGGAFQGVTGSAAARYAVLPAKP